MGDSGDHSMSAVRIAAAGDVHARASRADELAAAFAGIAGQADLVLLAGDLTAHGDPAEAAVLAEACRKQDAPVLAVLGNHDWHEGRQDEVTAVLAEAGVTMLERSWAIEQIRGIDVGVVGTKGFVGGFPGSHLPDFGEPLLRRVYAEASADVEALDEGLRALAVCPVRIVLLHYSPAAATLVGEPEGIWAFLGTDRMAPPIAEHAPNLVLHGHAHAGTFEGAIGETPVYNVSVPVMERDFWLFELSGISDASTPVH